MYIYICIYVFFFSLYAKDSLDGRSLGHEAGTVRLCVELFPRLNLAWPPGLAVSTPSLLAVQRSDSAVCFLAFPRQFQAAENSSVVTDPIHEYVARYAWSRPKFCDG